MPVARFQLPDGRVARFEVPEGTSPEQAQSMMEGYDFSSHEQPKQPKAEGPGVLEKIYRGVKEPIDAGAQMLEKVLPQSVSSGMNQFNNWLVDHGVPLERLGSGGVDQMLKQQESDYRARRTAAGESGIDGWRLAGNLASPVNLALGAAFAPAKGASMLSRVVSGATGGAAMGAAQPVYQGDYWTEKAKQTGTGAAIGGAMAPVSGALARIVQPNTDANVKALMAEGVQPTVGQTLGGVSKKMEDRLTSVPIIGDSINTARSRGIEQFNKAVINRSLKPIGETLPKDIKAGSESLSYAIDKLSNAYDDILPKLSGRADKQFVSDVTNIGRMVQSLPKEQQAQFMNIMENEVKNRFTTSGTASGESLKVMESQLGNFARGYKRSQDYNVAKLGEAVDEVRNSLRSMLTRNNPQYAGRLKNINEGYANLLRAQRAGSSVAANADQVFTPAQLKNAVKALDPSKNKRQFATNTALMQDLANAGKEVLPNSIPDSGTPTRAMLAYMLANPIKGAAALGGGILGSALYSPLGQRAANLALTARPQAAQPIADAIRQSSPFLLPGLIPLAYQPQQ